MKTSPTYSTHHATVIFRAERNSQNSPASPSRMVPLRLETPARTQTKTTALSIDQPAKTLSRCDYSLITSSSYGQCEIPSTGISTTALAKLINKDFPLPQCRPSEMPSSKKPSSPAYNWVTTTLAATTQLAQIIIGLYRILRRPAPAAPHEVPQAAPAG